MRLLSVRSLSRIAPLGFACGSLFSQALAQSPAASRIEPGLEEAVNWKWNVAPSATEEWGMPLPEALRPRKPGEAPIVLRPETYEVQKGDAIVKIARKFGITPSQLMQFNELKGDLIVIGQILRIPTPDDLAAMAPPPEPAPEGKQEEDTAKSAGRPGLELPPTSVAELELETVLLQVFMDREMFSSGPIDGDSGPMLEKISGLYQQAHPDAADITQLKAKALAAVDYPYTGYVLRAEDFRFIQPRKKQLAASSEGKARPSRRNRSRNAKTAPPVPSVTYDELVAAGFLAYTSAWEFVAERFHCDEAFLRRINSHLPESPIVGTVFQVPNVIPFEIEKALDPPLQPAANPEKPVSAAIVGLSLLEISQQGQIIAVMPVATARPGLRGSGVWTVAGAIPQPRMSTKREPREARKANSAAAPLESAQFLAPGPNNPAGIFWINLAKSKNSEPLTYYGLHGTSIPSQMKSLHGIGGLRLANWDIARAVRLIPAGTPLQWRAK